MKIKISGWLLITAFTLVGCGSTGIVHVGGTVMPPKPKGCFVAIFASESDVKRPFEKLCLVDAKTGSTLYSDRSPEGAMKRLMNAACACGADAIILTDMEKSGLNMWSWGSSHAKGVAICFTGPLAEGTDPLSVIGTIRYDQGTGKEFGAILSFEKQHKFADGTVGEAVNVVLPTGGMVWITKAQASGMLKSK